MNKIKLKQDFLIFGWVWCQMYEMVVWTANLWNQWILYPNFLTISDFDIFVTIFKPINTCPFPIIFDVLKSYDPNSFISGTFDFTRPHYHIKKHRRSWSFSSKSICTTLPLGFQGTLNSQAAQTESGSPHRHRSGWSSSLSSRLLNRASKWGTRSLEPGVHGNET